MSHNVSSDNEAQRQTYMRRGSRWIDCRQAARKGEPRGRERVATSQMIQLFWGYGISSK